MSAAANWARLYELGLELRDLAPWRWMTDTEVFGVQDPGGKEVGWCVVLGAAGELEGLCAYRGDKGFSGYQEIQNEQADADEVYGQDALVFSFGGRDEVSPAQRALIKELGLKFRGRKAWPAFVECRLGFLPIDMQDRDLGFMAACLEQALVVARRAQDERGLGERDESDRLLVRRPIGDGTWVDDRTPAPAPREETMPVIDQVELGRLRARLARSDQVIEVDVFLVHGAVVDSDDGPYCPAMALAVEAGSGIALAQEICHSNERMLGVQALVLKVIAEARAIPTAILVARPSVYRAVEPLAAGLDIGLERVEALPHLQEARAFMTSFMPGLM